jgi:hypothetical protein
VRGCSCGRGHPDLRPPQRANPIFRRPQARCAWCVVASSTRSDRHASARPMDRNTSRRSQLPGSNASAHRRAGTTDETGTQLATGGSPWRVRRTGVVAAAAGPGHPGHDDRVPPLGAGRRAGRARRPGASKTPGSRTAAAHCHPPHEPHAPAGPRTRDTSRHSIAPGETKRAALIRRYEQSGRTGDPRYGDPARTAELAGEIAAQIGYHPGTARRELAKYVASGRAAVKEPKTNPASEAEAVA